MRSYSHPNSAIDAPLIDREAWDLYQHLTAGGPMPVYDRAGQDIVADLHLVAERIACDRAARWLNAVNVPAHVLTVRREDVTYCPVAVNVGGEVSLDAEAAGRIVQRIRAGLSPEVAIERTLAQCEAPVLSESAIRDLERAADAHVRHLDEEAQRAEARNASA